MRFFLITLVLCICGTRAFTDETVDPLFEDDAIEVISDEDAPATFGGGFVVSWQIRRMIRKMQMQMPCGWPEYGIPPLAPFRREETNIHVNTPMLETTDILSRLKVEGLDNFKIQSFKLNMFKRKINFDFLFKYIDINAQQFETDTIVDLLQQLGLHVQYEGSGALQLGVKNLRVVGVLRYKLPVLWGSAKIESLSTYYTVESCESSIDGLAGSGIVNRLINSKIEEAVETAFNQYPEVISQKLENAVVPKVNKLLKGKDFWTLIDLIFSSNDEEGDPEEPITTDCVAQPDPWA